MAQCHSYCSLGHGIGDRVPHFYAGFLIASAISARSQSDTVMPAAAAAALIWGSCSAGTRIVILGLPLLIYSPPFTP